MTSLGSWLAHLIFSGLRRAAVSFADAMTLAHGPVLVEKMDCSCGL